jgi:carbamoyl-phosphate synthase large subunit
MSSWKHWNIAVTGVNARAESPGPGCAVARCIREYPGFRGRVIGLGYDTLDAGLYARDLCHAGYLVPYPSAGQRALLERIEDIHGREKLDVVVPCLDAEIQNFIGIRSQLAQMGIRMLIPSRDQFQMRAKDHLHAFCNSIGVLAPDTKTLTDPRFFDTCENDGWTYPLIIKGIFYDATVVYSAIEAKGVFHKLVHAWGYPVLVQKMVRGDEFDLSGIGDGNGNLLGAVMMRKRALTDKGKAGVTVVDEAIGDVARRIVQALAWRGPLEVEVMKADDGKIYLIEINPRFPSWIYLSHAVGRNLPAALLKVIAGDTDFKMAAPKSGTFFIRYAQELIVELPEFESMFVDGFLAPERKTLKSTRSA